MNMWDDFIRDSQKNENVQINLTVEELEILTLVLNKADDNTFYYNNLNRLTAHELQLKLNDICKSIKYFKGKLI